MFFRSVWLSSLIFIKILANGLFSTDKINATQHLALLIKNFSGFIMICVLRILETVEGE